MLLRTLFVGSLLVRGVSATVLYDRNLAYSSPFVNTPNLSHDTRSLQARHLAFAKRQLADTQSSEGFEDGHYPTFYGGDFSDGDPVHNSVLLWTRAVPLGLPDQSVPVCVSFKIFDNQELHGRPLDSGEAFTSYDVDFTLKVEAKNLKPDTSYWYRFADCTNPKTMSPVGKTRTISESDSYFNAYGVAAHNTSADIFVHLGDYRKHDDGLTPPHSAPIGRKTLGRELATIEDYRGRLSQYRHDVSLAYAHQNAPWITDDHEVADQAWKAGTADSNDIALGCSFSPSGACFTDRKLAAIRAYHEWMPIRQVDPDDKLRVWRNFQIGKLLDLTMLDTRQYDRDITDTRRFAVIDSIADEKSRSLMGATQEAWFYNTLLQSKKRGAIWRIVGQQIVFTQIDLDTGFDDAWDGYRANRNRVLDHLYYNKIDNTIILSGDSHANWASDVAPVSSTSTFGAGILPEPANEISRNYVRDNADLQWSEGSYRGFFTLTLNTTTASATYYAMRNVTSANLEAFVSARFTVEAGSNKLSRPVAGGRVDAGVLKVQG
ncbi:PhoD-like phosphatase-domain-containing protein [Trametes polyzona]|nr:PhoD-like phosphatase-domain-containing protein [Trametes polyzona]